MVFVFQFVYIVDYIYQFTYIETALNLWDKAYLMVVTDLSNVF